jgi:hypothetical protein
MTEYEIADLAASSVFELQGQVSLFQTAVSMMTDIVQQYMGILFGYIVAAYFIGASLGRRQVWVFTSLYVMWQIWMMGVIASRGYLAVLLLDELQDSVSSTSVPFGISSVLTTTSLALLVAALFASLYFMWSVRHPKAG